MQKVTNYGTYGDDRTAGTGVAYVRARMLPKKELLVAEPVMEEITADSGEEVKPMEEPAPVLEAEEIFTAANHKGVAPEANKDKTASIEEVKKEAEAVKMDAKEEAEEKPAKAEKTLTPMPDLEKDDKHSSLMGEEVGFKMAAEDYIAQAPKRIIASKVEVIKMTSYEKDEVQMMKTAGVDRSDIEGVEVYENEVVQPQKHIIVPKKDMGSYLSVGEEELHQIYNQPF